MTLMVAASELSDAKSPKDVILEKAGDLSDYDLMHNLILVAIYKRPEKTASGLYLAPQTLKEDEFQGTAGLVVKVGPGAFQDDQNNKFFGKTVQVGDWVQFRTSDGLKTKVNGVLCRLLEDVHIKARIAHPEQVW